MAVRPKDAKQILVTSKDELLRNVFSFRGVINNSSRSQKEAILRLLPDIIWWVVAFDTETRNWFVAPTHFCMYKNTTAAFYIDLIYVRRVIYPVSNIGQWTDNLAYSSISFAECKSAIRRMASYFGKSIRPSILIEVVKGYEPTRVLGYAFGDLAKKLNDDVSESIKLSQKARLARLAKASPMPNKVTVQTTVFLRNPDVIAEALCRAEGRCGSCGGAAPFSKNSDQSPFLEVHHKLPLSEGGEDTIENTIALCPNCHRQEHFGVPRLRR